eukprot:m.74446 g.74446  ORF g.74446 m.74446 type:complete len:274 (-) comp16159_c0_seq1:172-993(-)
MDALRQDGDIQQEAAQLTRLQLNPVEGAQRPSGENGATASAMKDVDAAVPLIVVGGTYQKSPQTAALAHIVGGLPKLKAMTNSFYKKCFVNDHLDQFIRAHGDPHADRLSNWIYEKMGAGDVWTAERSTRSRTPVKVAGGYKIVVHDRSSAHAAAWNSPKRKPEVVGSHFQLPEARMWMRLMFWSARENGLFESKVFEEWFVRFIGHFVRVYERQAPPFARESARWSSDPKNIQEYIAAGNNMVDVLNAGSYSAALNQLPLSERNDRDWPYEQ